MIDPWGNTAGVLSADRAASGDFAVPAGLPPTLYAAPATGPFFAVCSRWPRRCGGFSAGVKRVAKARA